MSGRLPPTLTVSTGVASPATPVGSVRNRPQGARRRAAQGLFIANPDNSDSDDSRPSSPVQHSPQRSPALISPNHSSPINISSAVPAGVTRAPSGSGSSTGTLSGHPLSSSPNAQQRTFPVPLPVVPPLSSSPQPPPAPFASPPLAGADPRSGPPQPPPQPERHRRAYTTPTSEHSRVQFDGSRSSRDAPSSPTRALPPLPPQKSASTPWASSSTTPSANLNIPYSGVSSTLQQPSTPTPLSAVSDSSMNAGNQIHRVASPDDGTGTLHGGSRLRAGSLNSRIWLQVTTDNESFQTVDISGLTTSDAIRERVFSRLRLRDDDHAGLSIYRTDIGEAPDPSAVGPDALFHLCQLEGDSKGSLKFLVVQTSVPGSTAAPIVPPPQNGDASHRSRPGVPPIMTDVGGPYSSPQNRLSKDSSASSGENMERHLSSSDRDLEDHSTVRPPWNTSTSSRSPTASGSSSSIPLHQSTVLATPHLEASSSSYMSPRVAAQLDDDEGTYRPAAQSSAAGSSSQAQDGVGALIRSGMDPATAALVFQIQREEEEQVQKEARERLERERQDEILAMEAQESEREVWKMMQQLQLEQERAREEQVRLDAIQASQLDAAERRRDSERQRSESESAVRAADLAARAAWDAEIRERDTSQRDPRPNQFAMERRERRERFRNIDDPTDWTTATEDNNQLPRRPSETQHDRPVIYSPPSQYSGDSYVNPHPPGYIQATANDPRLAGQSSRPVPGTRRPAQSSQPPYVYTNVDQNHHLQGVRSTDNLRPINNGPPVAGLPIARPPYPSGRRPITPAADPGARRQSNDRVHDGRYPTPSSTTSTFIPFPSPQPSWPDPSSSPRSGTLLSTSMQSPPLARPHSSMYDESPPANGSYHDEYRSSSALSAGRGRSDSDPHSDPRLHGQGYFDSSASQLPYAQQPVSWPTRRDTGDSISNSDTATTVSESTTIRPGERQLSLDDNGTARADWTRNMSHMISHPEHSSMSAAQSVLFHHGANIPDDGEATLFIVAPSGGARRPANLTVNTHPPQGSLQRPSSVSDSDTDEDRREQWQFRPDPEQLYDNLQQFFPKVDLDKPIVEPVSTPSTPSSESPRNTLDLHRPPPVHPARHQPGAILASSSKDPEGTVKAHARGAFAALKDAFNKNDTRRSIRQAADKKRSMIKANKEGVIEPTAVRHDEVTRLKRSSSMWGHKVVEVTPSKLASGLPQTVPESPSTEDRHATLNWVKGELIGKGSYGRVYLALNVTTGDMMAVKQVELPANEQERNDSRQTSVVDALKSEIDLLKDLYHPNIVAYLGCEASVEHLSIFLEYVPGGTIATIYRTPNQGRFEEQLVKFFTRQILEGLAYLHGQNIWHRDLKGDNILVDANGICKISDFGISKKTPNDAYDSFGNATNMKGSIFWMAPEVLHSATERSYSGKVDIWSLGCVVLEMWSGHRPFGDMEQVAAMLQLFQTRTAPPLPPDIHLSAVAHDFMYTKCMAQLPKDRPVAVDLLKHEFILDTDHNWTFGNSTIGKAVAKRQPKTTLRSASGPGVASGSGVF